MNKNLATSLYIRTVGDLEEVVDALLAARWQGYNVFVDYDNYGTITRLYSSDVTHANAYAQVYGMTKKEYQQAKDKGFK